MQSTISSGAQASLQPTSNLDKRTLRKRLRRERLLLTRQQRNYASFQAMRNLLPLAQYFSHHVTDKADIRVGVFIDAFGELPTQPLIDWAYRQGFSVYLPVVSAADKALNFAKLQHANVRQARLVRHRLGMHQPAYGETLRVQALDMLFMPLVAFDRHGHRMGMGGGFYDRTLAKVKGKPLKIGWAYDFQCVEQLEAHPWDVNLDMAVTPSRLWRFKRYVR